MRRGGIEHEPGTRPGRRGEVADQALALSEREARVRERPAAGVGPKGRRGNRERFPLIHDCWLSGRESARTGPLTGGSRAATPCRTLAAVACLVS